MSQFELGPDLDKRLRDSINNEGDFLANLGFILALLNESVIAPNPLFSVEVMEHAALPIFTTESDLEIFLTDIQMPEGVIWNTVPISAFWSNLMESPIDTVTFNPKTVADVQTGNLYFFDKIKLNDFLQSHSEMMNQVMSAENEESPFEQKSYFVPTLIGSRMYGDIIRVFPMIMAPDKKTYVPIFDNLLSLSMWYRNEELVKYFKDNDGQFRAMKLNELLHPSLGENRFGETAGIVVNPLNFDPKEDQSNMHTWEELDKL
ncbi:MAG TPA: hypothetical protein VGC17_03305 [Lactovum miscens]|uniref:hypothetical protein n=1 Tax=Lactovum miscens TaxID=190387 RepID=UPI002EDA6093